MEEAKERLELNEAQNDILATLKSVDTTNAPNNLDLD
jgi:hypothetical protein